MRSIGVRVVSNAAELGGLHLLVARRPRDPQARQPSRLLERRCPRSRERHRKRERLTYGITSAWSRQITAEHRFVDQAAGEDLVVLQACYHYETQLLSERQLGPCPATNGAAAR